MKPIKFLNSKEVKAIQKMLVSQFEFEGELDYYFSINNKNKVYIINKDISRIELASLRVDTIGLYFGEIYNETIRLSIEGSQIIGPNAKKNIVIIEDEQVGSWMKGEDLEYTGESMSDYVLIKNKNHFLGCGKIQDNKLRNYISKSRKLKVVNE
jgi:NOL1/NOP2/fmu family ribosome biogenesis protein